jgi:hypothetical protein
MQNTWSRSLPANHDVSGYSLPILETYLYYDGPVIFLTKIGFEKYLVSKVDTLEGGYLLVASSIEDRTIDLLKSNRLSILGALRSGDFIVIECTAELTVRQYWPIKIDSFDQEMLPDPGKPLALDVERVADTADQAEAYFSIRLSGDKLSKDTMSFHHFKKMVDKAYVSVRNLLAPNELRASKSQTYDFKITEPEFGSLVININKPSLPSDEAAKRIFEKDDVTKAYVEQRFWEARRSTMEKLTELKIAAKNGVISDGEMSRLLFLVRDIAPLLPDSTDLYSDIEFISQSNGKQSFLHLDKKDTQTIQRAYSEYTNRPNDFFGKISIINEGSHTVVLKLPVSRDLTCHFSAIDFAKMKLDPRFKTGNLLTVHGVVNERKLRDFIRCESVGLISEPRQDQMSIFD